MKVKYNSYFKNSTENISFFKNWIKKLEVLNSRKYEPYIIDTSLGKTSIWGLNSTEESLETLVIFPGARTTSLFWDFDRGLDNLQKKIRIFLVETNGLPNLSEGNTPDIKSLDYGLWASEVLEKLNIDKAFIAGASFGGLISMKLSIVSPEKIKAIFLLNPACLQFFSLGLKNLYYNILPLIKTSKSNVEKFIDKVVLYKPYHKISKESYDMLIDYEVFAIKEYKDNTQKPYYMNEQLSKSINDVYLLESNKDLLFPFQKSIANANVHIKNLKEVKVFENVGHGIETYNEAMKYIGEKISEINNN